MSTYAELVRRKIEQVVLRDSALWQECQKRSQDYMLAFGISPDSDDLCILNRLGDENQEKYVIVGHDSFAVPTIDSDDTEDDAEERDYGFIKLDIDGERFCFFVQEVGQPPHYSGWRRIVMASCVSNADLNNSIGVRGSFLNVVPEEWHQKIIRYLKNERLEIISD